MLLLKPFCFQMTHLEEWSKVVKKFLDLPSCHEIHDIAESEIGFMEGQTLIGCILFPVYLCALQSWWAN